MTEVNLLDQVTIVVVTYNSAHCLDSLDSLLRACPHVVVSDNGSLDGTPELAAKHWPHATVLAHGRNLGFGAANNRALAGVKTPFAFLLNPDCEVSAEQLAELVRTAQAMPDAALLAPQLLDARGQRDINYRWPHLLWKSRGPGAEGPACVGFVCGAAMLLRLERFEQMGYFDEAFFLYYEDDDLCLRLFKSKQAMVIVPHVHAVHRNRGSVKGSSPWRGEYWRGYHHAQSKLIFARKHRSTAAARRLRWTTLVGTTFAIPLRLLAFSPRLLCRMAGRWMGLTKWNADER